MFRFVRYFVPVVLLVTFSADLSYAQPGGDSRSRGFMSFLDRNRNGVIEPDEFDRMPGRFKEMLESAGVDTSRSMTAQEYERVMPRVMEQMRSRRGSFGGGDRGGSDDRSRSGFSRGSGGPGFGGSGFGGPPSSFSRSRGDDDDDRDDRSRGGFDRDSTRGRYGSFQSDRGRDEGNSRSRSSSSQKEPSKPVRTTVDLNSDFVPHDTDQDGQIGLYEWRKNNPGKLSEFFSMDLNGDGFLTPKEIQLSKAGTPQRSAASFMFALNSGQSGTSQPAPQESSASATPASVSKSAEQSAQTTAETKPVAPSSDPMVSQANYFFKLLDRDKDNSISAEEWKKSRSMRRMFEEASIDLTVTMSQEQFVKHYIAIKKN
ncbi:EF hand [Gimesia chilikensis]|uniref:EF hand n=2 Tax=Gimesia chilikensis TaxID=2605989 RepID=A0A517WK41_9PLAN|nr:EF hand [Gimesia chilikensis]